MNGDVRFESLIAEAAGWRALSLLYERPRGAWHTELRELAGELTTPALAAAVTRAAEEGTEAHYLAVLGPGGLVSPREIAYRRLGDPGHLLAQLGMLYEGFGYRPSTEEPPDHVSVETGFVGFLRMKQSFALAGGDAENVALVRRAVDMFVSEHLVHLAGGLFDRLEAAGDTYLREGAAQLSHWVGPVPAHVAENVASGDDTFDCANGCSFLAD